MHRGLHSRREPDARAVLAGERRAARAQAVSDLAGNRRLATLVAFAAVMPQVATDEAIEVFDLVRGDLIRSSSTKTTQQRLRTPKDLDAAAISCARRGSRCAGPPPTRRATSGRCRTPWTSARATWLRRRSGLLAREPDDDAEQMPDARYNTVRARYLIPAATPLPAPVGFASGKGKVKTIR